MALTFPRDLVLEAWIGGAWLDVTELAEGRSLRQVDPVSVTWGLPNEQARALAPPSTAEGVLNNAGGHWTPGNPMGDYYRYLQGRNVPTRLCLRPVRDAFGRTVASGWGSADTGEAWQTTGAGGTVLASDWSVGSGVGVHSVPAAVAYRLSWAAGDYRDLRVAVTSNVNVDPVTGGDIELANVLLRRDSAGSYYFARGVVASTQMPRISIYHHDGGTNADTLLVGPVNVPEAIQAAGHKTLRCVMQAEGETLRAKLFVPGAEPYAWQVAVRDARLTGAGGFGVRSGVGAGNTNTKPIVFENDDFEVRRAAHTGELTRLEPTWDATHRVKKAKFKAAGVTQRLGRPQRPALSSAIRRYAAGNPDLTVTDFWPLDESSAAVAPGQNALFGGQPAQYVRPASLGGVQWGSSDANFLSVPAFPILTNNGTLYLRTRPAPLASSMSTTWAMRISPDDQVNVRFDVNFGGGTAEYEVNFFTDGHFELGNFTTVTVTSDNLIPPEQVNRWVTFGLTLFDNGGGSVGYHFNVDGQTRGVGSFNNGRAYTAPVRVRMSVGAGSFISQEGSALSSVVVTPQRLDSIIPGTSVSYGTRLANVIRGWVGERSLLRAYRLCAEEGVPFDYWGDPNQSRTMGPQRPAPLLDQLVECAEADQGFLYEPRYTAGVAIRSRRSMLARPAVATLRYDLGQVAQPLAPSADDRPTANVVRAERTSGGSYVLDTPTGPMNSGDPGGADPDSVGESPVTVKVNAESELQLPDVAGWARALGTVPDVRFPSVVVNLRASEVSAAQQAAVLDLGVGDRLVVQNLQAADQYRDLDQLVRGGRETFRNVRQHAVALNTAPYAPYLSLTYNDGASRWDGLGSSFDLSLTTTTTGARAVTVPVQWVTDAAKFPLDVECEGERITVSGMSGTAPSMTLTISARSVNGVVKAHNAGAKFRLWQPRRFA